MQGPLKTNVLVCDDIEKQGRRAVEIVESLNGINVEAECVVGDQLKDEVVSLFDRVGAILGNRRTTPEGKIVLPFEHTHFGSSSYDIVILDNNLKALTINGARYTADAIAGYVRAFTHIPYVVSLNKNPQVDFDLGYLVGDRETPADLAVNEEHLRNRALWTGQSKDAADGFLPWYWPALLHVPQARREQISFVREHIDCPLLEMLSFPRECIEYLSRHAKGALSPTAEDDERLSDVTFRSFFIDSCSSVPMRDDRQELSRSSGSNSDACDIMARIVAAEIDKWLRRDVIGPQDVLVDIPHLLMRMPFLLGYGVRDIGQWNEALKIGDPPFGLDREVYGGHLAGAAYASSMWVTSPCFWWPKLKSCEALNEIFLRNKEEWADAVFCEDISTFKSASKETQGSEPEEFAAELEGSWRRRYVARLGNKNYVPRSRFAK